MKIEINTTIEVDIMDLTCTVFLMEIQLSLEVLILQPMQERLNPTYNYVLQ